MFSKPNNPPATPPRRGSDARRRNRWAAPPQRTARQKLASLIAADMSLEGNIASGGELQIDGTVKGDVRVDRVTIGEGGHVEGASSPKPSRCAAG